MESWNLLVILVTSIFVLLLWSYGRVYSRLPLPPGPPGSFISGNLHIVMPKLPWVTYTDWKDVYGRLFLEHCAGLLITKLSVRASRVS